MRLYRHSVSHWCFSQIPLATFAAAVRELNIESVELLEPADWPVVRRHGLICALARGPDTITDSWNRRHNHARLVPAFQQRLQECAAAGVPNVVCFSGNRAGQSDEEGLEICAEGFRQVVGAAEKAGVTLCLELLNSKVDHPDYQCDRTAWGVELCQRVGSERLKLLYDIYHMQIMEGDVVRTIREYHPYFAHYHTAGCPDRHELDDDQELNYRGIMRAIAATGFKGFVGQEFIPAKPDMIASLAAAVQVCDV